MGGQVLIQGPIPSDLIAQETKEHQGEKHLGAHALFLGQVRADRADNLVVKGIEYSAYEAMVGQVVDEIRQSLKQNYPELDVVNIFHSVGRVGVGEISLLVFVSGAHRKQTLAACSDCVEEIKAKLPVWKKEVFTDGSYRWLE